MKIVIKGIGRSSHKYLVQWSCEILRRCAGNRAFNFRYLGCGHTGLKAGFTPNVCECFSAPFVHAILRYSTLYNVIRLLHPFYYNTKIHTKKHFMFNNNKINISRSVKKRSRHLHRLWCESSFRHSTTTCDGWSLDGRGPSRVNRA